MSLVYWIADGFGSGITRAADGTAVSTVMLRWIRDQGNATLIVNGGDIYPDGKTADFDAFWHQADEDVTLMCETPGNHDWRNAADVPGAGRIPHGYETFWSADARKSKQPIDSPKKGAARYEHFIDMDGWRLLFLDTGDYNRNPWPGRDEARADWLTSNLKPGRSNIILAHHSRIGRAGPHGDNNRLDRLWKTLFDASGAPRAVFTLAGHNHNVCIYGPKSKDDPEGKSVSFARGIYVFVNGAGGRGHYRDWFLAPGTRPDIYFDDDNFCATRINLIDAGSIDIDLLSFGTSGTTPPVPVQEASVKIRSSLS